MDHKIIRDYTSSGHLRFTCHDCNQQIVKQPYMNNKQWNKKIKEFYKQHEKLLEYLNMVKDI
jgi:transposase-like protein